LLIIQLDFFSGKLSGKIGQSPDNRFRICRFLLQTPYKQTVILQSFQ